MKIMKYSSCVLVMTMAVALITAVGAWPQPVHAHEGHAGSVITYMSHKKLLRSMLPEGAKIVKRKEKLSDSASEWAEQRFAVDLDTQVYTYYLARDKASQAVLGGALSRTFDYRHGKVELVIGLDDQYRVTKAALNAISEKYTVDFEGTVGTGYLTAYDGKSIGELAAEAQHLSAADKPTHFIASKLSETAALLAAFMHGAQ